jgi:pilus assembly protein CpaC
MLAAGLAACWALGLAAWPLLAQQAAPSPAEEPIPAPAQQSLVPPVMPLPDQGGTIVHHIVGSGDHIEMLVNTSRILMLDQKIPQAQVNNPDILDLVALSPTQVQISARRAGVTQVNLWSESKRIFTVDIVVTNDARELAMILRSQFPKTALTVTPIGNAVLISGYVDQQDAVQKIIQICEQYYPKVINNMTVSGVQQVLLHVKLMEVSRTKLRNLGFDFANISDGSIAMSGISGLLSETLTPPVTLNANVNPAFMFSIFKNGGNQAFFGVLEALRQDGLSKILTEPTLVVTSGRPAYLLSGGEIGYQVSSGLSGTTVGFKEYGTRVDFVPLVLGNGKIHLDVRPSVSELDAANSIQGIPALKTRVVETGVEMEAGQTLAIGGLVERITDATVQGFPWLSDIPVLGALFRSVHEETNEIELLILVTPEFAEAMDPCQVPCGGPGLDTASPNDWDLFFRGHIEVPVCRYPGGAGEGVPRGEYLAPNGSLGGGARPDGVAPPPRSGVLDPQNSNTPPKTTSPAGAAAANSPNPEPPYLGPIGYDVQK